MVNRREGMFVASEFSRCGIFLGSFLRVFMDILNGGGEGSCSDDASRFIFAGALYLSELESEDCSSPPRPHD